MRQCLSRAILFFLFAIQLSRTDCFGSNIECVVGCSQGPEGQASAVRLSEPFATAFDPHENLYICEHTGQRILRVDPEGNSSTIAGTGNAGYSGDGGLASAATFHDPHGLVISRDQIAYVADTLNHCVRAIDLKSGKVTTLAGTGEAGYSGDGGLASKAHLNEAYAVAIDGKERSLYVADLPNHRIRRVDLRSRLISSVAGNGETGVPQDGEPAIRSPLVDPRAVTVDSRGNIYVLERGGNALRVVDSKGRIRTIIPASSARSSSSGQARPTLNGPKHLCVDQHDRIIIADTENHRILRYDPAKQDLVILAGTGRAGHNLDLKNPLSSELNRPHGVFVHRSGALFISDSDNHRILKLTE